MLINNFKENKKLTVSDKDFIGKPIEGILKIIIKLLKSDTESEIKEFLEPAANFSSNT